MVNQYVQDKVREALILLRRKHSFERSIETMVESVCHLFLGDAEWFDFNNESVNDSVKADLLKQYKAEKMSLIDNRIFFTIYKSKEQESLVFNFLLNKENLTLIFDYLS